MSYQSTSARYNLDNLDVHDRNLIFALELGTNVVRDVPGPTGRGDAWNPTGSPMRSQHRRAHGFAAGV